MHAQAALDFDLRRFRTRDVVRRASADELRLHHHVALALRHRLILLVLDVREADARHLTDDHAAIFHLGADVESLHRLVEIRFHHGTRLQPAPGADDQQNGDTRGNRANDKQPKLEIVRFLAHAATGSASRLKNWRTHGSSLSSRSLRGSPSAAMPFLRRSSMITRSAIEKMLGS